MVEIAKANAREADLEDVVVKQMRLQDLKTDKINGVIISIYMVKTFQWLIRLWISAAIVN